VDADMILDPGCFEALHALMGPEVGIASAGLRDPLVGRVSAVKMFRTACFAEVELVPGVSPDSEFVETLSARGWLHLSGLWYRPGPREAWHTQGEHRPRYEPDYVFSKFRLEGQRQRVRRRPWALRLWARRLHASVHPLAHLAEIALLDGFFRSQTDDFRRPLPPDPDLTRLAAFLASDEKPPDAAALPLGTEGASAAHVFDAYRRFGHTLSASRSAPTFSSVLETLARRDGPNDFLARVALCRGLLVDPWDDARRLDDWRVAKSLVDETCPS
jgi:hypothetical protein